MVVVWWIFEACSSSEALCKSANLRLNARFQIHQATPYENAVSYWPLRTVHFIDQILSRYFEKFMSKGGLLSLFIIASDVKMTKSLWKGQFSSFPQVLSLQLAMVSLYVLYMAATIKSSQLLTPQIIIEIKLQNVFLVAIQEIITIFT